MEEATAPGHQPRNNIFAPDPHTLLTEKSRAPLTRPAEADSPRRQKRRKISTACEPCRARKIRCDGGRPICGPCSLRLHSSQQTCLYAKDAPKEGAEENASTKSLIDRIQSLERVIAFSSPLNTIEHGKLQEKENENENENETHRVPSDAAFIGPRSLGETAPNAKNYVPSSCANCQNKITASDTEAVSSPVNAMGSASFIGSRGASPLNAGNEFYGDSSAAHFMQQIKETIPSTSQVPAHGVRPSPRPPLSKGTPSSTSKPCGSVSPPSGNLSLPPRDLADTMLENYWTKACALYPFVHKPSFARAYEDLWKPYHELQSDVEDHDLGLGTRGVSDSRTVVFHCALNAIFALSCQLSCPGIAPNDREPLSQMFFLRSKSLLHVDILDHGSIALVQTLLIIAQYLQSTSFPSRCWTTLGLACRLGQGLGLHVEDRCLRRDPREVELRRRIWYGCAVMDIVASTTLGRPMMTPCHIIIPLPSVTPEDESLLEMDKPLFQFTFYIETIKLYLILGRILSTVYKPWSVHGVSSDFERQENSSNTQPTDLEAIMSFDDELSNFEDGIVSHLHWERGIDMRDRLPERWQWIIRRQTNVLHARYLHIRLLLHRPTFLRFCRMVGPAQQTHQPPPDSLQSLPVEHHFQKERNLRSKMDMQSSVACVGAAVDLINFLFDSTTKASDGAWWYTTFYVCTAAMVLVLAELCLKTHQNFDHGEIHGAWMLCCKTLRTLAKRGHPVERALSSLCNIYQKLVPDQSPTELSANSQSVLSELGSVPTEDAQQISHNGGAQDRGAAKLGPGTFQEQSDLHSQGSSGLEGMDPPAMQPWMDFMTQDLDFMQFGLIDESWWRLQNGDTAMNFGV